MRSLFEGHGDKGRNIVRQTVFRQTIRVESMVQIAEKLLIAFLAAGNLFAVVVRNEDIAELDERNRNVEERRVHWPQKKHKNRSVELRSISRKLLLHFHDATENVAQFAYRMIGSQQLASAA